jgi:hypothetical protein
VARSSAHYFTRAVTFSMIDTNFSEAVLRNKKELAARFANLFMICYRGGDISGMHVTLTAFTHVCHALHWWGSRAEIARDLRHYLVGEGFPAAEEVQLDWLLNHYFENAQFGSESLLLAWYQKIDDEWVLRRKLRELFPDKSSSELTEMIVQERHKNEASPL